MTDNNPYQPSQLKDLGEESKSKMDEDDGSLVSDTIIGVNTRWKDNLFQAAFIGVTMFVFAAAGGTWTFLDGSLGAPWYGGAIMGAIVGMFVGVFLSGIVLGVYRASKHIRKSD